MFAYITHFTTDIQGLVDLYVFGNICSGLRGKGPGGVEKNLLGERKTETRHASLLLYRLLTICPLCAYNILFRPDNGRKHTHAVPTSRPSTVFGSGNRFFRRYTLNLILIFSPIGSFSTVRRDFLTVLTHDSALK